LGGQVDEVSRSSRDTPTAKIEVRAPRRHCGEGEVYPEPAESFDKLRIKDSSRDTPTYQKQNAKQKLLDTRLFFNSRNYSGCCFLLGHRDTEVNAKC